MHTLFLQHTPIQLPTQPYLLTVSFCYNHMYRRLTNPKRLGSLPHSGIVLDDIVSDADGTLFDVILQIDTPQEYFFTMYEVFLRGMTNY